jgi:hypothetical protein
LPSFHCALLCAFGETHSSILLSRTPFLRIIRKPALSRQCTFFVRYSIAHHALITGCVRVHFRLAFDCIDAGQSLAHRCQDKIN